MKIDFKWLKLQSNKSTIVYQILAFALKCWNCHSSFDPDCGDPFQKDKLNQTMYADCSADVGPTFCYKTKSKLPNYS